MSAARYEPPTRAAMTDEALLDALGSDRMDELGTLQSMQLLERETALRQQDQADFDYWVAEMVAENSESARRALSYYAPHALADLPPEPAADALDSPVPASANEPSTDSQFIPSPEQLYELDRSFEAGPATEFELPLMPAAAEPVAAPTTESAPASTPEPRPLVAQRSAIAALLPKVGRRLLDFATSNDRQRPASQFWAWFGIAGTAVPVLVAALLAKLGFSFGQNAAALALGFIGSAVVISVGSLAGKRSGLPTAVISRAAFGVRANLVPILPVLLSKLFWVIAAAVAAAALLGASNAYLPAAEQTVFAVGGLDVAWSAGYVALVLAFAGLATAWGGRVLASLQKLGGLFGVVVATAVLIAEAPHLSGAKLDFGEGVSNLEVLTAAILVVACMGLAWVSSGADFARKLPNSALGVRVVGWALVGLAVVPTTVGIVSAAAFSDLGLAQSVNPVVQLSAALPQWAIELLVPGLISTLVVWIAMALYSANLGMQAIGLKLKPATGAAILAGLAWLVGGLGYPILNDGGIWKNLAGLALAFGVPVAAWAGVFIADVLLRRIAYHEVSLSRSYGFYGAANWMNLGFWLLAVAVGYLMTAVNLFGWRIEGALIVEPAGSLTANLGLFASGVLGLVGPLVTGIPRIKQQEREVLSIEARRRDLADIFDGNRELGFDQ